MTFANSLSLYAGPKALKRIRENGFRQDDFDAVIGASGGPKWFVLYGLDRFLSGSFFADRDRPLELFGSSAGAWRLACMAHAEPLRAIEQLAINYARQQYSSEPTIQEISREAGLLLSKMLGESGVESIVSNPVFSLRIITDRCRGLVKTENRALLTGGLGLCAVSNAVSRKALKLFFERVVFYSGDAPLQQSDFADMPTRSVRLDTGNLAAALMATGSIPLVMEGVQNIAGAPDGVYRDGGMTDYHFDLPFNNRDGLVLYPHFYSRVTPGWFDKLLPWRSANPGHFDNVLLVAPSEQFVSSLPYGKIPDRNDFLKLDDESRLHYWAKVLNQSERLADELAMLFSSEQGVAELKPFGTGA